MHMAALPPATKMLAAHLLLENTTQDNTLILPKKGLKKAAVHATPANLVTPIPNASGPALPEVLHSLPWLPAPHASSQHHHGHGGCSNLPGSCRAKTSPTSHCSLELCHHPLHITTALLMHQNLEKSWWQSPVAAAGVGCQADALSLLLHPAACTDPVPSPCLGWLSSLIVQFAAHEDHCLQLMLPIYTDVSHLQQ